MAAAPNGDFVTVGHNVTRHGNPIAITLVRFGSDGTLQWRVDLARHPPSVGRLLVDSSGNAYLAFNSVGDGQDIQLLKYSPSGYCSGRRSSIRDSSPITSPRHWH